MEGVWKFFIFASLVTGLFLLGFIYADVHTVKTSVSSTGGPAASTELAQAVNCSYGSAPGGFKTAFSYFIQTDTYAWNLTKSSVTQLATIPAGECIFLPPFEVGAVRMLATRTFRVIINGTIQMKNEGNLPTVGLNIVDTVRVLSGCTTGIFSTIVQRFPVDVSSHPILAPGETWQYPYVLDTNLIPGYNSSCRYRNDARVNVSNHLDCLPGCNVSRPGHAICIGYAVGLGCPGPEPCPWGPLTIRDVTPRGLVVATINENAIISDVGGCAPGFNCTTMATPDDVCLIANTSFAACTFMTQVCNVNASCDSNLTLADYAQLVTVDEEAPLVVTSNTVQSPVYTGVCALGCTLSIGYWKTHAGFTGNNADRVTQYLPLTLGCPPPQYAKGANVTSAVQSTAILTFNALAGGASNGLNKLAAQLLAAKLNVANGAQLAAVTVQMNSADTLLCQYGFNAGSWSSLSGNDRTSINEATAVLDAYNNGQAGVPHCQ